MDYREVRVLLVCSSISRYPCDGQISRVVVSRASDNAIGKINLSTMTSVTFNVAQGRKERKKENVISAKRIFML